MGLEGIASRTPLKQHGARAQLRLDRPRRRRGERRVRLGGKAVGDNSVGVILDLMVGAQANSERVTGWPAIAMSIPVALVLGLVMGLFVRQRCGGWARQNGKGHTGAKPPLQGRGEHSRESTSG